MRPIRKQELDYLDRLINNKFQEKQSAIRSQCELEVEKQLEKDFTKFLSTLKLEKLLKEAQDKLKTGQGDIQAQAKATADSLKKAALERAKKLLESQKKGVLDGIFKKPQPAKKDSTK